MAYNYLVAKALESIWAAPRQDKQSIIQPARLTGTTGTLNRVVVMDRKYQLPETKVKYHVFQIGQLHPVFMGVLETEGSWVCLADCCNEAMMQIDIYLANGLQLPRFSTYYRITSDKNVIVAVRDQPKITSKLGTLDVFLRFYSNIYFDSADSVSPDVYTYGGTPTTASEILAIQHKYDVYAAKSGTVSCTINGYIKKNISLLNVSIGDVVEFFYDSSVRTVVDFAISDLKTFDSILDSRRKYLIHPVTGETTLLAYHDDVDFELLNFSDSTNYSGLYINKNAKDAIRMVTHRDYSIAVAYLEAYAQGQSSWSLTGLTLRLKIRDGGTSGKVLPFENNRICDLYKLSEERLMNAFLGVNSTVPYWRADNLENSLYCQLMRSTTPNLGLLNVENMYGYNAISKLLGDTPTPIEVDSNRKVVSLPFGLENKSTGFEYDSNGKLVGWSTHTSGSTYVCAYEDAALVEVLAGYASTTLDETYGESTVGLSSNVTYRYYICPIVDGTPNNVWVDVTDDSSKYVVSNLIATWLVDTSKYYTLVRSNANILTYKLALQPSNGVLSFTLQHTAYRNASLITQNMQIPMGVLDIYLNGYSLIEGVDYIVDFPKVVICNKKFLNDPLNKAQSIVIRMSGHSDSSFSRTTVNEYGFVQGGLLSKNNTYDVRDDRVIRIVVDGCLKQKSDLKFAETSNSVSVDATSGTPYSIQDIVVPTRGHTTQDTYVMRAASKAIDEVIGDYMTEMLDQPSGSSDLYTIKEPYKVFSPFMCALIYDLNTGALSDDRLFYHYDDEVVMEICKPYEWLLAFDPSQDDLVMDDRFVTVHPHNLDQLIEVSIYFFKFLKKVEKIYMNGRVNISNFLTLKSA